MVLALESVVTPLAELIDSLPPGAEVVLTRGGAPVATIRAAPPAALKLRALGTGRGSVLYMAPDFDAIPEGFEEYVD